VVPIWVIVMFMERRIAFAHQLADLLQVRGEDELTVTVTLEENQANRSLFDRGSVTYACSKEAEAAGWTVLGAYVSGQSPNHGWMGPGTRTAHIRLARVVKVQPTVFTREIKPVPRTRPFHSRGPVP